MSIMINRELCVGCGKCRKVCPGSLLKEGQEEKAYIAYPKDCWGCAACVKECPVNAISLYLGADVGGKGSRLSVEEKGNLLCWKVEKTDGTTVRIEVNKKDANQY